MTYPDFLQTVIADKRLLSLAQIYHHVRNIPYGSNGNRDPRVVYESNVGSCSGKHILLRDLLRQAGYRTEIITMFTYFNESTPVHDSFPDELKALSAQERVPDFHHYVRVFEKGSWSILDATWHDAVISFGFPVNNVWYGQGNTRLASVPEKEYPNDEDIIGLKKRLIASLPPAQQDIRSRYFKLVTAWIGEIAL